MAYLEHLKGAWTATLTTRMTLAVVWLRTTRVVLAHLSMGLVVDGIVLDYFGIIFT